MPPVAALLGCSQPRITWKSPRAFALRRKTTMDLLARPGTGQVWQMATVFSRAAEDSRLFRNLFGPRKLIAVRVFASGEEGRARVYRHRPAL